MLIHPSNTKPNKRTYCLNWETHTKNCLTSGLLINLQSENSHTSSNPISSPSLKYATQFFLFLFKRRKPPPPPPSPSKLFANVLSQWKIQRLFKKQSGVERLVDQRKQYSYSVSSLIATCLCKLTNATSSWAHFPLALAWGGTWSPSAP